MFFVNKAVIITQQIFSWILHDNVPLYQTRIVLNYLSSYQVNIIERALYSPDMALCALVFVSSSQSWNLWTKTAVDPADQGEHDRIKDDSFFVYQECMADELHLQLIFRFKVVLVRWVI